MHKEQGAKGREQNCRAGASPADLWNGKRERLPYKLVIRAESRDQTEIQVRDREAQSLTREARALAEIASDLKRDLRSAFIACGSPGTN